MKQIERIQVMEERLNRVRAAADALEEALDGYEAAKGDLAKLERYYTGKLWRKDYEDREAGKIPEEILCGVLSEDAVYDLLTDTDALKKRMNKLGKKTKA